jgi:hypothetical protein
MYACWGKLYSDMTPSELALEPAVASLGVPYRTQFPFFLFDNVGGLKCFPDFLLLNQRVIIEVDDDKHFTPSGMAADKIRTAKIEAAGYSVVRVTNADAQAYPYEALDFAFRAGKIGLATRPPESYLYRPFEAPSRSWEATCSTSLQESVPRKRRSTKRTP